MFSLKFARRAYRARVFKSSTRKPPFASAAAFRLIHLTALHKSYMSKTHGVDTQPTKKQKMEQQKIIGTHNGTFHCDEALAVFLLRQTAAYRESDVIRTRDSSVLSGCDIVVDVGAVYDEEKQLFDHHQRGFVEVFGHGFSTKLSSAGLIYKHFGKEIIADKVGLDASDPSVTTLWLKLYQEFIEAIDGIDNGISQYSSDVRPKYRNRTDLSSRVAWLNPAWNQSVDSQIVDSLFFKASQLTGEEFLDRLNYYAAAWLPGRALVQSAISGRANVESSGKILLFEQYAPWKEHLFGLEAELRIDQESQPLYVLYPDETAASWRIQAVPISAESFESRKALPDQWRGLRDDELSKVSGVDGCIFVHASGFIGGNKTKEGVLELAKLALSV